MVQQLLLTETFSFFTLINSLAYHWENKITMIENLLLCVGAQKSGTTWLHAQLKDHPQIGFSHVKEVHYFNTIHNGSVLLARRKVNQLEKILKKNRSGLERYFSNLSAGKPVNKGIHKLFSAVDDEWYMDLFAHNTKKYAADFTPEYALLPDVGFDNFNKVCKRKKIIFIMRDPIDRAKSAVRYFFETQGKNIEDVSLEQLVKVASSDFIINMSSYELTIRKLERHFNSDELLYLFFEDVMKHKQESLNKVTRFLDIAEVAISDEQLERKVNVTSKGFTFPKEIDDILKLRLQKTYVALNFHFGKLPEKWATIE